MNPPLSKTRVLSSMRDKDSEISGGSSRDDLLVEDIFGRAAKSILYEKTLEIVYKVTIIDACKGLCMTMLTRNKKKPPKSPYFKAISSS